MAETPPIICVIVPTYNRRRQLARTLEALSGQVFDRARFEVIVVDDGSKEPLDALVNPFKRTMQLRLLRQAHSNAATARNRGAAHAEARYLAFTDDDCLPAPDWLKSMEQRLTDSPDRMYAGHTVNNLVGSRCAAASQSVVDAVYDWHKCNPAQPRFFASNNIAMSAKCFQTVGGFDGRFRFAEDREFCERWARCGFDMVYAPEAVVYHEHVMSLGGLLRQHFNYGRGAHAFHRAREARGSGQFELDGSFCLHMWRHSCRGQQLATGLTMLTLVTAAQLANAAGYLRETIAQNGSADRELSVPS